MEFIFIKKEKSANALLKTFRDEFSAEFGYKLDFRRLGYISNSYGAYPQNVGYEQAEKIVSFTYNFCNSYIEEYKKEGSQGCWGFVYNLQMSVEKFRLQKVSDFIQARIEETFIAVGGEC